MAEAYPYLSAFTNAHFPFGLALLFSLLDDFAFSEYQSSWKRNLLVGIKALMLSLIMPFGMPVLGVVLAQVYLYRLLNKEYTLSRLLDAVTVLIGGAPMVIYYVVVTSTHPVLKVWNAQNQTVSPNLVDLLFSFSPALIFACFGAWEVLREKRSRFYPQLIWLAAGVIILYAPLPFQRRFISGLYFPVVVLAMAGLKFLWTNKPKMLNLAWFAVFMFSLISSTLVFATGFKVAASQEPLIYLRSEEAEMISGMADLDLDGDLVLADTRLGNFLPAYLNVRVLYGHAFETVNAEEMAEQVNMFYAGMLSLDEQQAFFESNDISYLLVDEQAYDTHHGIWQNWPEMLSAGTLKLYQVQP